MMNKTKRLTMIAWLAAICVSQADPQLTSWHTEGSRRYARLYTDLNNESSASSSTTWSRGQGSQSLPTYAGIQSIRHSDNWVYIETTGLGSHVMGPWFLNEAKTQNFPNFPSNTGTTFRIPRNPAPLTNHQSTGAGAIGYFVDGVAMFDSRDTFSYQTSSQTDGSPVNGVRGDGVWNRDAYVNEGVTFDAAFAHQAGNQYHYHANPPALRHQLGDHVNYDAATNEYTESNSTPNHSPILAWLSDGYPLYGPYGYSDPNDPSSTVIRMRTGYQKRDGSNGTDNLASTGRTTLPAWAATSQGRSADLPSSLYGPSTTSIALGHYIEDYDHLGSHGFTQGKDYDLDIHNGRFCVTPEFPEGTYAYFVTIEADGNPKYPYNLGRTFYGNPTGGAVNGGISEQVTVEFRGGADSELSVIDMQSESDQVTLTWTSIEGGSYRVEESADFQNWTTAANNATSQGVETVSTLSSGNSPAAFYRVILTEVDAYDATGNSAAGAGQGTQAPNDNNMGVPTDNTNPQIPDQNAGGNSGIQVNPANATRGSNIQLSLTLDANSTPPLPPAHVNPSTITIGSIQAQFISRNNNTINVMLNIPAHAPAGSQTISITFPGPGGQTGPTYTSGNAFKFD